MRISHAAFLLIAIAGCGSSRNNGNNTTTDAQVNCAPEGAHRCTGATYETCTNGDWMTAVDCPIACADALGCVQCTPGQSFCKDGNVWSCDDTGNPGMEVQACTGANTCQGGACVDACADAANSKSYIGCEYWAVDLDNAVEVVDKQNSLNCLLATGVQNVTMNVCAKSSQPNQGTLAGACDPQDDGTAPHTCPTGYACQSQAVCILDAQHSPFAIVVSNPQSKDATVTVTGAGGQTVTQTVAAGQVASIKPQAGNMIPDQSTSGTGLQHKAYKVTSDLPIVAYQFNPLDNVNVFSNDASLLIPRTAYDVDYYTMSWPTLDRRNPAPGKDSYYGYVTVVAWQDNTQITVTPTTAVQASATQTTIAAGAATTFTLNAFDVLQLEASGTGDLSGTHIASTNNTTFGVFGGHQAAAFGESTPPSGGSGTSPCCADHLEEMLFPSTTWGKTFAITRSQQRTNEPDYIRVMAQKPGTSVTFTPAPAATVAGDCSNLGPGELCDVKIQGDTEISSTEPILVGQYLESSIWASSNPFGAPIGNGDPSMAIAVPTEQYRTDYTILIPASYDQSYLSISAPATGGVTVDGTMVNLTAFPGGSTYRAARVMVAAGQHTIQCADGCGVLVYGYSDAVSYMFAGGLDLKQIVIL